MTPHDDTAKLEESLRLTRLELAQVREQLEVLMEEKAAAEAAQQGADPGAPPAWRGRVKRALRRLRAGSAT